MIGLCTLRVAFGASKSAVFTIRRSAHSAAELHRRSFNSGQVGKGKETCTSVDPRRRGTARVTQQLPIYNFSIVNVIFKCNNK